ncbi:MAG TPA: cobalamin-independent methionine synthase II family protein [Chloroflexota bacterium]|jgi:5-methyltetrahydropteroyltriglutamate--homocysteine methyltransferase
MAQHPGRILTTHTGSLPRPKDLFDMMLARDRGEPCDEAALQARIVSATAEVVKRQVEAGIDVVSDGEYSKTSYTAYVKDRLTGFDGEPLQTSRATLDQEEFPDFSRELGNQVFTPSCNGPVSLKDPSAVRRDISNLQAALKGVNHADAFMTAPSPGQIARFMPSTYYTNDEEYLYALAGGMQDEYQAIVGAGFVLQLDCPDLASGRANQFADLTLEQFKQVAALHIEVLNHAIEGLPEDRLRLHLCWGNYEGPHNRDVALRDIIDLVLQAHVGAFLFEAANPRHAHEWKMWREVALPQTKAVIPGVIDSCTNYIEHPELVAERLVNFAGVVGRERVMAGTDCGFGTALGVRKVAPSIAWAKLQSMAEGARLASQELWHSSPSAEGEAG